MNGAGLRVQLRRLLQGRETRVPLALPDKGGPEAEVDAPVSRRHHGELLPERADLVFLAAILGEDHLDPQALGFR